MLEQIVQLLQGILTFFRKRKPLSHKDWGAGTTFKVLYPAAPFKLLELRFHLSGALAADETFTLTRVNALPLEDLLTHADVLILSEDMGTAGSTSLIKTFDSDEGIYGKDDTIVPALSANTGPDTWGLEIVYELL